MSWKKKADDWQVTGVCQVGGAVTVGGGIWLFQFQSYDAGPEGHIFMFVGAGFGLGGSIGGASLPLGAILDQLRGKKLVSSSPLSWSDIDCDSAFSADNLNYAPGRITTGGAGLAVGYSLLYISAKNLPFRGLFHSQSCGGWGTAVGASAITTVGFWKWVQPANYDWGA
ncbi:MAG: hypothetical protein NTW85_13480 [Methylococcales bacterium]|nr:hypothetical protein [Methylococcales bacterium]